MPIKQIGFKTSVKTGTGRQEGAGTSLARLLLGGMETATKMLEADKKQERLETAEEKEQSRLAYLTTINGYKTEREHLKKNGQLETSDSMYELNEKYKGMVSDIIPNTSSEYNLKLGGYFLDQDVTANKMMNNENKNTAQRIITTEIASLNASELSIYELKGITDSVRFFNDKITPDEVIRNVWGHTSSNAERDFANITNFVETNDEIPTEEELIKQYGGDMYKETGNKSSKEYKAFETAIGKIASDLKKAHITKQGLEAINSGVPVTNTFYALGEKESKKLYELSIDRAVVGNKWSEVVRLVNDYRAVGGKSEVLDNMVTGQLKSQVGDLNQYNTFNRLKEVYNFDAETLADYNALEAIGNLRGLDYRNQEDLTAGLQILEITKTRPVEKGENKKFLEAVGDNWFEGLTGTGYSVSQKNYIEEIGRGYMQAGMDYESAKEQAEDDYDKLDSIGTGLPTNMFALTPETAKSDSELVVKSFSPTNSLDDTDLMYLGSSKWSVTVTKDDKKRTLVLTNAQMKKRVVYQRKILDTRERFTKIISGEKLTGNDAVVKKLIIKRIDEVIKTEHPEEFKDKAKRMRLRGIMLRESLDALDEAERADKEYLNFSFDLF